MRASSQCYDSGQTDVETEANHRSTESGERSAEVAHAEASKSVGACTDASEEGEKVKRLALLFSFALVGSAQVVLMPSSQPSVRAGGTVTATVTLAGSSATGPGAFQWSWSVPSGWALSNPGGAATGRTVTCGIPTNPICVVWGLTRTPHPNGQAATVQVTVPAATAPGNYTIGIANPVAANVATSPATMAISVASVFTIRVLHKSDLNGDGSLTVEDALAMAQQAVGNAACTDDQNGDGKCDAVDIQIVANAIVGN